MKYKTYLQNHKSLNSNFFSYKRNITLLTTKENVLMNTLHVKQMKQYVKIHFSNGYKITISSFTFPEYFLCLQNILRIFFEHLQNLNTMAE